MSTAGNPALSRSVCRLAASGEVSAILPGVYAIPSRKDDPVVLARAVGLWNPHAVVTGALAARLQFWPQRQVESVEVLLRHGRALPAPFVLRRSELPAEATIEVGGCRLTVPPVTAVWLAAEDHGLAIDEALRVGATRLEDLEAACDVLAGFAGSLERRRVVRASRGNPWSAAERVAHQQLVGAGIKGWRGNVWFSLDGMKFPVDICFPKARLVVEVDGYEFHSTRAVFERERRTTNALIRHGWTVLHVTWEQLHDGTYFVDLVRQVLRSGAR